MNIYIKILLLTLFLFISSCSIIDEYVGTSDEVSQSDDMDHEQEEENGQRQTNQCNEVNDLLRVVRLQVGVLDLRGFQLIFELNCGACISRAIEVELLLVLLVFGHQ